MEVLYVMIPIALLLGVLFLGGFLWAVRTDQWEDLDSPAYRVLFEEKEERKEK
jgi:cbb3-type cytochrome oxidase maturation protein